MLPHRRDVFGIPVAGLILFFAFADLMLAVPRIDLASSALFYTPGVGFALDGQHWERIIYHSVEWLMVAVNLALVALWLFNRIARRTVLGFTGRKLALLLCLLAMLPGLLVNQVLKENWGRARPAQVTEFGGERRFTPAFVYSDQGGRLIQFRPCRGRLLPGRGRRGTARPALGLGHRPRRCTRRWSASRASPPAAISSAM